MSNLERILEEAKSLSPHDRERLVELLRRHLFSDGDNDAAIGARGLTELTESTRNEDWSDLYPATIRERSRKQS